MRPKRFVKSFTIYFPIIMNQNSSKRIQKISESSNDPREAYLRMRRSINTVSGYIRKVIARNMYSRLGRLGVGTTEVEATAQRVVGRDRPRSRGEVVRILKKRANNIQRQINKIRFEVFKHRAIVKQSIGSEQFREYNKIEKSTKNCVWKFENKRVNRKIDFLVKKREKQQNKRCTEKQNEHRKYYKVTDSELDKVKEEVVGEQFVVYGNVILNESEKKCLSLGPKFMITPELNEEDYEVEVEVEAVKTRMELHKQRELKEVDESREENEKRDKESRNIFNEQKGELQMSKMRVTDAKYNIRSYPPREAGTRDELKLQVRHDECMYEFNQVKKELCNKKGRLKNTSSNITIEEQNGMKSLKKRMKEGEIIITTTDKSGKYAVMETDLYRQAAKVHIKDKMIDQKNVNETEVLLNRHSQQIIKALQMGTVHGRNGQVDRIKQAFTSVNAKPGPIYFLIKDHKKLKEGEKVPPTRPVCSAKGGPGSRLSNLISTILNKVADAANSETECMSTEEAMSNILKTNREIEKRAETDNEFREKAGTIEVISMDVKALYPSLKAEEVEPIVYGSILELQVQGKLEFVDVDYHEVGKYLAIVCNQEELKEKKLLTAVPVRNTNLETRGRKPGPAYWESETTEIKKDGVTTKVQKWTHPKSISEHQEKRMIALMLTKAAITSMRNHMYSFDNRVYKQEDGGPIGDELSQAIARIVMQWWDKEFLDKCHSLGVEIPMYLRYVDDANIAVIPPQHEMKYVENRLVEKQRENREPPDELIRDQRDKSVAELLREIGNSIVPMLQFEEDYQSNHSDCKLPILDLKVWTEARGNNDIRVIRHEFYRKPMANQATLKGNTAYPTSQIRAIMVEEVMRRLRNCDPQTEWEKRGSHLTKFAAEMRSSGHKERFRQTVFEKAINKYTKELSNHREGTKDMYRSREVRQKEMNERGGKNTRDSWYKKGQNGQHATSVMKIPYTQGSILKKRIQKKLTKMTPPENTRMRVIEGGGNKLKNHLVRPDPFVSETCSKEDCETKDCKGKKCFQGHVNYKIECLTCLQQNEDTPETHPNLQPPHQEDAKKQKYIYYGETARGTHVRFKQHKAAYRARNGFMWDHDKEIHEGKGESEYEICAEKRDCDPLRRVLRESIRITKARKLEEEETRDEEGRVTKVMNRKGEFFGVKIVRVNFEQE